MKFKIEWLLISVFILTIISYSHSGVTFEERPLWLLESSELPNDWIYDTEFELDNRYYFSTFAPSKAIFSIETLEFENQALASNQVADELQQCKDVHDALSLIYAFPNDSVDLSVTDNGYVWEIKSPCCISRGVVFSIENVYIYIFGSQASKWSEVEIIYNLQVAKALSYFNREVPENLLGQTVNNVPSFGIVPALIALIGVAGVLGLKKLKQKR
ncbi:MAG: hypothetical protein ACFFDI_18705 [Promethearchaeota archaeon]